MKRTCSLALAASLLIFAPSYAGAFVFSTHLEAEPDTLPEVDVTARSVSKTLTAATPFHSIDHDRMLHTGINGIADAIRRMPGTNLRDYGGAGGLKTVSVRGLGAQHTGVSYDGVALSDARSGEIDLSRYSLDNVESLSLVSGDVSEIFIPARSAASAATLSISSFSPGLLSQRGPFLSAQLRAGGFGLWNPYINGGWSDGERLAIGATAEFLHARNDYPFILHNGSHTSHERRTNSMMNSTHAEINGEWRRTPAETLTAKVYVYDNCRRLPGPVIYYLTESHERLHDRNIFGQARWRRKLNSTLSVLAVGKFNWSSTRYSDTGGQYPGGKIDQKYLQRESYLAAALLWLPAEGWAFDYSADWVYQNLGSNLPTDTRPFRNTILQSVTARYNVWRLTATARLLHTLYLDRAKDSGGAHADFHRFSPSVNLSLRPIESRDLFLRASYRNIFRAPTFNELYFDHYGTLNLKPESADQWNVGVTWGHKTTGWLQNVELTADGYLNMVSNKIVAVPFNLFKWTMTNLGKVQIFGTDITLNVETRLCPRHTLLLAANYSYQRARPRTSPLMLDWNKQLAYTPLNSGSASLSWLNPWVVVAVSMNGTSSRYTTSSNLPGTRIAGYAELGVTLFRRFRIRNNELGVRVDLSNLLDKQYQVVARYPMPGRNWSVTIDFQI